MKTDIIDSDENDGFIILYYMQEEILGQECGKYPHISPIGNYIKDTNQVKIMDVDSKFVEPYWTNIDTICKAINKEIEKFGNCGYIKITFE